MIKSYILLSFLTIFSLNLYTHILAQSNPLNMTNYAIDIDIFRKGTYKIFTLRLKNRDFEAIRHSTVHQTSDTIIKKSLGVNEVKDIELILSQIAIDSLNEEYINKGVKGEHHLIYHITRDEKHKDIYVYYEDQADLVSLYNKLMVLVPEDDRIWYYR